LKPIVEAIAPQVVIDRDPPGTDHFENILLNQDCSFVFESYAKNLRISIDDVYELGISPRRSQMWVNGNVPEKTETSCVAWGDQEGLIRPAAHRERTLNDRPGGAAQNDTTSVENSLQLQLRLLTEP
jgi:hypothetical protein